MTDARIEGCVYASQEGRVLWDIFVALSDFNWDEALEQARAWKLKPKSRAESSAVKVEEAKGKITTRMVAERIALNLDSNGECGLSDDEKFAGHCLTGADVKALTGQALGMSNTRYVRPIIYKAWREGLISSKKVESIPGYTVEDKVESSHMEPVRMEGVIWAPGEHHLSINGAPGRLIVTEENILDAYPLFKEKTMDGGILVDVEHVAGKDNLLSEVYDGVAAITSVRLEDGGRIIATEITPLTEEFMKLLEEDLIRAFSVSLTASIHGGKDGAHYIDRVYDVDRVSLVKNPACPTCRVERIDAAGADEDGRRARITFGGEKLAQETVKTKEASVEEAMSIKDIAKALEEIQGKLDEVLEAIGQSEKEEEEEDSGGEAPQTEVVAGVESSLEVSELADEVKEMKEKLRLQEAKSMVEAYVEEGKVLPRDLEKHVKIALSNPEGYRELMEDAPVLIEMSRKSIDAEAKADEGKPTYRELLEELKKMRGEV